MNPALFNYKRRLSSVVSIGNTPLGGHYPIRVQSMTNTSTMDTESSAQQCIRIVEAGGEYVRLTAQGVREAENLKNIEDRLHELGYHTPLVADIHFNPKAAEAAAKTVEKVRINPGNFSDPVKTFSDFEYTDEEYALEVEKIREKFIPFLDICKENHTAIRIGVNHGSLSDRIMSRYGDTPQGMVESCLEFLRICVLEQFTDIVISIKASNTFIMVCTVRLLIREMDRENMKFPLHLGVTEAGDGEDGRIKSAVGIGTLLAEGIGDTIRVSLSENPELEIPVAQFLREYITGKEGHAPVSGEVSPHYNAFDPERRKTIRVSNVGGNQIPIVISDRSEVRDDIINPQFTPDYIYVGRDNPENYPVNLNLIVDYLSYIPKENTSPLFSLSEKDNWVNCQAKTKFIRLIYSDLDEIMLASLKQDRNTIILLASDHSYSIGEQTAFIHRLMNLSLSTPVIILREYDVFELERLQMSASIDCGRFFLDKLADGIMLKNKNNSISIPSIDSCSFGILQASGSRISKTEYISCPGCGRTLFDLQSTIKKVKLATSHLTGLKIGVMGCIVNGPGEMADADYGYVGSGLGKINLYKGKECVEKNIPESEAVEQLIKLVKKYGDWKDETS